MLSKTTLSLLLTASLSCFGQVVSTGGYATNAGPSATPVSAANAPLVATPEIALPGSGPAHGAPLGNTNTNDSRFSTGPSVYNPNSVPATSSAETTTANGTTAIESAPAGNTAAANEPFEFGVQQVISGAPAPSTPPPSLGEIARNLRAHPVQPTKVINNETVARLNANPKNMGNLIQSEDSTVAAGAPIAPSFPAANAGLMARNEAPALPQSDQSEAAEQPQAPAQPRATAGQQKTAATNPASARTAPAPSSANDAASATPSNGNQADTGAKLPQTATHLPLLLLFGGLGVAGGALYLVRR